MAVYTALDDDTLRAWLAGRDVGALVAWHGIESGIENSNFFVTTDDHGVERRFVLTVFERLGPDALAYDLPLMRHLAEAGLPCPSPTIGRDGSLHAPLAGKPATLVTRLDGRSVLDPSPAHCAAIGAALARMHVAGARFDRHQPNPRGFDWWMSTAAAVRGFVDDDRQALLDDEIATQSAQWHCATAALPRGPIHADLFRDNALFVDEAVGEGGTPASVRAGSSASVGHREPRDDAVRAEAPAALQAGTSASVGHREPLDAAVRAEAPVALQAGTSASVGHREPLDAAVRAEAPVALQAGTSASVGHREPLDAAVRAEAPAALQAGTSASGGHREPLDAAVRAEAPVALQAGTSASVGHRELLDAAVRAEAPVALRGMSASVGHREPLDAAVRAEAPVALRGMSASGGHREPLDAAVRAEAPVALRGMIDFYFAGDDVWILDVAICLNDWCVDLASGAFDDARVAALLAAYDGERTIATAELDALPLVLRAAALRFWLSRLHDLHRPRPAQLLTPHDPLHFERLLRRRRGAAQVAPNHLQFPGRDRRCRP